ncbi:MFS transporter [Phenylobacterium sp. LjRoot219]|uniref:MFS transporter n=1 Tax=Phenylobacterium sp. LjRoot219 TaxID=3342283 RepID=UPI003ED12647
MSAAERAEPVVKNHPAAPRMAAIAFLNQNITLACIWGSFSVVLGAVETRLGVGRELSTLAIPLLNLVTAVLAAMVGVLATRFSLRLVMLAGAALGTAGFALLALTASYPLYLIAFGALLGPAMAIAVVLPPTLVTRWYQVNRGKALGIISTPVLVAIMPLAAAWTLQSHGLVATYAMLAALAAVNLVANLFIIDRPPGAAAAAAETAGAHGPVGDGAMSTPQLLRSVGFWAMALAFMASAASSIVLTAHMVPMARAWGFSTTLAATLLSIQAFAGIAGTLVFGWVADRLGGVRALGLVVFDAALLWLLLLLELPFPAKAVVIALIGLHGAGALPVMSVALSERFGRESFSRAFGLTNLVNLPVSVACVPAAALVYTATGSYAGAIVGVAAFLGVAGALVFAAGARHRTALQV